MLKVGLSNLRRLGDVQMIELRRITLLVGRNSSGKSSFLRTFPLFRQSITTRTSSPILWYGDLVDFGSFATSASDGGKGRPITFSFGLDEFQTASSRAYYILSANEFPSSYSRRQQTFRDVKYTVSISPIGDRTRVSKIDVTIGNINSYISIDFDNEGRAAKATIDGIDFLSTLDAGRLAILPGELLPTLRYVWPRPDDRAAPYFPEDVGRLATPIRKMLRAKIDRRVADKTIIKLSYSILANGVVDPDSLKRIGREYGHRVRTIISDIADNPLETTYQDLKRFTIISSLPLILRSIGEKLISILSSTLYTGPARARSERYYRYQDLSVSEIDPDGKNFPMFLNSLNSKQMASLSSWVHDLFGYGVNVSAASGHISIQLTDGQRQTNIVDVGYGVSQILPVLGQIWWARERPRSRGDDDRPLTLLAIEQPELHLHPAHQALLADALVGNASRSSSTPPANTKMHYLVETHSETMINRLGELVATRRLPKEDVQIILFEPSATDPRLSNVVTAEFGEDGSLQNWPYGFFQPDID